MPRNRMIKPEYWNDEKLGSESESVQLTFIGTWTFSDDYGVVKGNPVWLKNQIFPYKQNLRLEVFTKWLETLETQDMIIPFTIRGEKFYFIRTFRQHQSVEKPSKTRNCNEEELINILQSLGYEKQQDNSWLKVGEQSGNSRGIVGDEVKRSISVSKSEVNRAKALVIAGDDSQRKLRSAYDEIVKSLEGKERIDIWNTIREFISTNKPKFIEPYIDLWNIFAINLNLIKKEQGITDYRRKKFATRIQEPAFDFIKILERIKSSRFARGDNSTGWKVRFEFIIEKEEKYVKILEDKYDF